MSRGFNEDDVIHKFSMRKIVAYVKAYEDNVKMEHKRLSMSVRVGSVADSESFNKIMQE